MITVYTSHIYIPIRPELARTLGHGYRIDACMSHTYPPAYSIQWERPAPQPDAHLVAVISFLYPMLATLGLHPILALPVFWNYLPPNGDKTSAKLQGLLY